MTLRPIRLFAAFLPAVLAAQNAPDLGSPSEPSSVLDHVVAPLTAENANLPTLFHTIGKTYGVTITVDPNVKGTVLLRFNGGTLRQLLQTLLDSNDLFMEDHAGTIAIKRSRVEFYFIEYPQIARSASSSTSVSLSPNQNTGLGGYTGVGGPSVLPNYGTPNAVGAIGGTGSSGSTSFSIAEKSEDSFWGSIEADIKTQKTEEENISPNRFSGIVAIETTRRRHQFWKDFFKLLNERINAQVLVEVRIDEVTLNSAHKLGIDWTQVQTAIGQAGTVGPITTTTAITNLGAAPLPNNTVLGNFSAGKLSAVFTALQQQGEVKMVTKPSLRLLNNQKGFVKVGEDRTFWSLYSNVSINQPGVGTPQTTTQDVYQGQQQTFGVVLPVTAQISRDDWVTLVLEPARTQLNGVDTAPDHTRTSPQTGDQSISTMIRLRDGETSVLGGLVTKANAKQANSIPGLNKIPWLGRLARTDAQSETLNELIMTVTVHIIR